MFALFFSLYRAMFMGHWAQFGLNDISTTIKTSVNAIGELITSIFNNVDAPMSTLGDILMASTQGTPNWVALVSFVLALITSIGIVFAAGKGVKKAFGIFFGHIR